jgi:hypothetical protein
MENAQISRMASAVENASTAIKNLINENIKLKEDYKSLADKIAAKYTPALEEIMRTIYCPDDFNFSAQLKSKLLRLSPVVLFLIISSVLNNHS